MLIIIDDVVGNSTFETDCLDILESNKKNTNEINFWEKWYSLEEDHVFRDFCIQMINVAGDFFDLTNCRGYEFWTQNNTRPRDWHVDQDEQFIANSRLSRHPLCSIVYYVKVDKLKGGKLHVEDDIVTPKSNRMVIFSPKLNHCVEPHMGDRIVLCVNPWSVKL